MLTRPKDDGAASPVVGMLLVLAITAAATTSVLVWGIPAINTMRADVEHQSVVTEFKEFDADVLELTRATATQTAKMWRFSQSQGSFAVLEKSERWTIGVDTLSDQPVIYNTTVYDVDDRDNRVVIINHGTTIPVFVRADFIDGATAVPLKVEVLSDMTQACPASYGSGQPAAGTTWDGGVTLAPGELAVCLYDGGGSPAPLEGDLLQLEVRHQHLIPGSRETASWLWIGDVGRAQWSLDSSAGRREVFHSNGMLLHGDGRGHVFEGNPTVAPPQEHGGEWRWFGRVISLSGSAAHGGEGRADILLNLYGGRTLADEVEATRVKMWFHGELTDTWMSFFTTSSYDYGFIEYEESVPNADGERFLLYTTPTIQTEGMKVILHHSVIRVSG